MGSRIRELYNAIQDVLIVAGMVVGCSSPVLVDMVGPENISAAFSGILAFCGLSSLIGPPLAGMMVGVSIISLGS